MKYLLMIHLNPSAFEALTEEQRNAVFAGHDALQADLRQTGELVGFAALADPSESATVRVRDGVPAVTDGPYIEAKEIVGGFAIVEVKDLDEALAMAKGWPAGAVEVRPVVDHSND